MTQTESTPDNLADVVVDRAERDRVFRNDVIDGLKQQQKAIPSKHLYDARGSELFSRICETQDYYVTRTERAVYDAHLPEIATHIGPRAELIEPGGGDGKKARLVLGALDDPAMYVPIEISLAAVDEAASKLAEEFPEVAFHPICADFTKHIELSDEIAAGNRVVYFPGSTIGNFELPTRRMILERFAELAGANGTILIGVDLIKSADVLHQAYDDSEGVSSAFNTNLLQRINRELDADFDTNAFEYKAIWNAERSRVEMGQESLRDQTVTVDGEAIPFAEGEFLHVENSYKFTVERFNEEAAAAGLDHLAHWVDPKQWFCVGLFRPKST